MRISEFCENYFNVCDIKCNTTGIIQFLSYFTVIIPLGLAATYGIVWLYGRVTKKQQPSELDKRITASAVAAIPAPRNISTERAPVKTTSLSQAMPALAVPTPAAVTPPQKNMPSEGIPPVSLSPATPAPSFHLTTERIPEIAQLYRVIDEEEPLLEIRNNADKQVRKEIIQRVRSQLDQVKEYSQEEQVKKIFDSLWNRVVMRPGGRKFLQRLLMKGVTSSEDRYDLAFCYTDIMLWLWNDHLIEFASKIKDTPKATGLSSLSHEEHARAIRAWYNDPKTVENITRWIAMEATPMESEKRFNTIKYHSTEVAPPQHSMPPVEIPVNNALLAPPALAVPDSTAVTSLQRNTPAEIPNTTPRSHPIPPHKAVADNHRRRRNEVIRDRP